MSQRKQEHQTSFHYMEIITNRGEHIKQIKKLRRNDYNALWSDVRTTIPRGCGPLTQKVPSLPDEAHALSQGGETPCLKGQGGNLQS